MTYLTYLQPLLLISITLLSFFPNISSSANTLVPNQSLMDNQTLVSAGQRFELGFFIPSNSRHRYLGIWYKNISPLTVVWVANRNTPLTNSSGVLNMDQNGNLVLLNQGGSIFWSSNQSKSGNPLAQKPTAKLLDSGNLVVTEESDNDHESYLWQSFDQATDTLLPGMKLGWDLENGVNNSLVSWKSVEDPSTGDYSFVMESHGSPEIFLLHKQAPIYRSGPWNGIQFSGVPEMSSENGIIYSFVHNGNQKYYSFVVIETFFTRLSVDTSGKLQRLVWLGGENGWISYWDVLKDQCENYNKCGAYGICNTNESPVCTCVNGFEPKNKREWDFRDGSDRCVQKTKFDCGKDDGFLKFKGMKLPDCSRTYYDQSMNLKECKEMCKKNCSCTAYANSDIRNGGNGCIIWIGELVDLRKNAKHGQDLYVRVAASELHHNHKSIAIIVTVTVVTIALLLGLVVCFIWKKKRIQKRNAKERGSNGNQDPSMASYFGSI